MPLLSIKNYASTTPKMLTSQKSSTLNIRRIFFKLKCDQIVGHILWWQHRLEFEGQHAGCGSQNTGEFPLLVSLLTIWTVSVWQYFSSISDYSDYVWSVLPLFYLSKPTSCHVLYIESQYISWDVQKLISLTHIGLVGTQSTFAWNGVLMLSSIFVLDTVSFA